MALDIDFIRSHFPAFSDPEMAEQAFFESAGGSYPCRFVVDRLTRFYNERKVQPYGPFDASRVGGEEMDEARLRLSRMLGVEVDEVSFGPSTTQNTYVLAQAFRGYLKSGDSIVVTNQDHEANSGPWRRLEEAGVKVREWQIDPETGHLDQSDLGRLLDGAKLLCFPHCSNVIGEINDVASICATAHAAGAVVCVDGVSYAPHGFPNVDELGADIYLFSAYKTYGPHQGVMVIRRDLGMKLPNQGHSFNAETLYKRFTPAGPDHAQIAACAGMADYVDALFASLDLPHVSASSRASAVHDEMRAIETQRLAPLLEFLSHRNSVRLLGPTAPENRAPTVAIATRRTAADLAHELAAHGVNTCGDNFYAVRPLQAMGIEPDHGVLRMSFTHYTSKDEIDHLTKALDHIL